MWICERCVKCTGCTPQLITQRLQFHACSPITNDNVYYVHGMNTTCYHVFTLTSSSTCSALTAFPNSESRASLAFFSRYRATLAFRCRSIAARSGMPGLEKNNTKSLLSHILSIDSNFIFFHFLMDPAGLLPFTQFASDLFISILIQDLFSYFHTNSMMIKI